MAPLLAIALAGQTVAQSKPPPVGSRVENISIEARPLDHFQQLQPERRRFGRLQWVGGLVLTSSSSQFGGWSGLLLASDGKRLVAISDAGSWLSAEVTYSGQKPTGLRNARIGPLLGPGSKPLARLRDRDAEALTLLQGNLSNGTALIAFEGNHRIGRFTVKQNEISSAEGFLKLPPAAKRMSRNLGFESVSVLAGGPLKGSVVAFSEHLLDPRGNHSGWLWTGDTPRSIYLAENGGFDVTDAASLPDGSLLVLERRFRWTEGVKFRLRLVPAHEIASDAVLRGETLFEADMAYEIDNMEGVAVHRGPRGETVITLISDDNFNSLLQRTVMLQFNLIPDGEARAATPNP